MSKALDNAVSFLNDLKDLVYETNEKTTEELSDPYFSKNVNFFSKSFMIILSTYLESYLKEVVLLIVEEMNQRLKQSNLPYNLVKWNLNRERDFKVSDYKFESFMIELDGKDLDREVSGDVGRTITTFKKVGIDLTQNSDFKIGKDKISTIITKRNDIVHHGDNASDVTFGEIIENIDFMLEYIRIIDAEVMKYL